MQAVNGKGREKEEVGNDPIQVVTAATIISAATTDDPANICLPTIVRL